MKSGLRCFALFLVGLGAALSLAAQSKSSPFPLFSTTDVNGRQVNVLQWRGRVVLLTIKYIEPRDEKQVELRRSILNFCNQYRSRGLDVVRIVSKKNIPFFISKSYIEKRAVEADRHMGENYTIIVDWDLSLKKLLGLDDNPLIYLIDRGGFIRWSKKGNLQVDGELDLQVRRLLANGS